MSTPHWQTAVFCSGIEISCVLCLHHLQHVVCRKGKNMEPCSWKILWSSPGSIIYHFHPFPFIGQRLSIWWTLTSRKAGKCSQLPRNKRKLFWESASRLCHRVDWWILKSETQSKDLSWNVVLETSKMEWFISWAHRWSHSWRTSSDKSRSPRVEVLSWPHTKLVWGKRCKKGAWKRVGGILWTMEASEYRECSEVGGQEYKMSWKGPGMYKINPQCYWIKWLNIREGIE